MGAAVPRLHAGSAFLMTLVVVGLALQAGVSHAQITFDGTLGGRLKTDDGRNFRIEGGTFMGRNLFHSFKDFNIQTGQSATFVGPSGVANILSRVTGGQSFIDGRLASSANLFLLNPNGVVFGTHASLDVSGSFHVSTANYMRFADNQRFYTDLSHDSVLTAAAPAAFGFVSASATSISVEGAKLHVPDGQTLSVVGGNVNVRVPNGQVLAVTGGDLTMTGSMLTAPGGQIRLVAGARQSAAGLTMSDATLAAPNGLVVLARAASSGEVSVRSAVNPTGRIDITASALLDASGIGTLGSGTVLIRSGRLVVDHSTIRSNTTNANGAPLGIDLQTSGDMLLANSSLIETGTPTGAATGRAGDISLTAGTLTLSGGAVVRSRSRNAGRGGAVTATAGSIDITGSSSLFTEAQSGGGAGGVILNASSFSLRDGGSIRTTTNGTGPGGDIDLTVGELTVVGGAKLISETGTPGGAGGNIVARGANSVVLSDSGSGIFSNSARGHAGDVFLDDVGTLTLTGGAQIQSGNLVQQAGATGNVKITARNSVTISAGSGISSVANVSNAGQVTISAPTLNINNGFINTSTVGGGNAGDISLVVGTLTIAGGGQIVSSSQSRSSGHGGNVMVSATGSISISGTSPTGVASSPFNNDPRSGLFSTAEGRGAGGNINVQAGRILLNDAATISAKSSGTGGAGNITIGPRKVLQIHDSLITTEAATAGGGSIVITGGSLVDTFHGSITTSVHGGGGNAGNITIDPQFVVLDQSQVRANAFGGRGGNIKIVSDFFLENSSSVTASSERSVQGTITIQSRFTDVSSSVAPLPTGLARAATLLRASCAARVAAGKASSLAVTGREGVPLEPGGYLPSPLIAVEPSGLDRSERGSEAPDRETSPRLSLSVFAPACSR